MPYLQLLGYSSFDLISLEHTVISKYYHFYAYVGMVKWLERRSPNWKVEGSIPELWHIDSHADPLRDL